MKRNGALEKHSVPFGKGRIEFRLRRTVRRTLAITVKPDKSVVVTAPLSGGIEAVKTKMRKRGLWVRRQQDFFSKFHPKLPPRRYVSGETHRYLGRQYRLKVVQGPNERVKLRGRFLWAETRLKRDSARAKSLVRSWYSRRAGERFGGTLDECLVLFHGRVEAPRLVLRRMRKRWGSCTRGGVIYLNPELVLAPPSCIEYVITHELCHLLHPAHGPQFFALLRKVMPNWEERKARLELIAAETGI